MEPQIITVTSKGQIAIPKDIRNKLNIESGTKLFIYTYKGSIILKVLKVPNKEEFRKKLDEAEKWAESVGLTEDDVSRVIKEVRQDK